MKVTILNIRGIYKKGKFLTKLLAVMLLVLIVSNFSSKLYITSRAYESTLSEITDKSTIILDAGHGGEDCGAIGVDGIYEKDLNLMIANEIGKLLSEKGFAVIYTRTDDALLYTEEENIYGIRKISDLKNRCKIGAEHKNAIFVSIHMNSYKTSDCTGLQVYYSEKNSGSYALAASVQRTVQSELQKDNRRQIKPGKDMFILENLENPAILIECGFLTNPQECKNLAKKEYQKELSFAIFCGIIGYIDKGT